MISRIGLGASSVRRFKTANVVGAPKRRPPATCGVEHAPQAKEIGPLVDCPDHRLLGRHVERRSDDESRLREVGIVDQAGQAEVGDLYPTRPILQHDVARLDVAVDEPCRVRSGQAPCELIAKIKHVRRDRAARSRRASAATIARRRTP